MIYDKNGIKEWLSQAKCITTTCEEDDGNFYETRIYKKDDKFYVLHACNNTISCKWHEGKGYKKGYNEFEPIEVFEFNREEEVHYIRKFVEYRDENGVVCLEQDRHYS
jgi:hypothetical protein